MEGEAIHTPPPRQVKLIADAAKIKLAWTPLASLDFQEQHHSHPSLSSIPRSPQLVEFSSRALFVENWEYLHAEYQTSLADAVTTLTTRATNLLIFSSLCDTAPVTLLRSQAFKRTYDLTRTSYRFDLDHSSTPILTSYISNPLLDRSTLRTTEPLLFYICKHGRPRHCQSCRSSHLPWTLTPCYTSLLL